MRTHRWLGALAATVLAACGDYGAPDEVLYGEAVYSQGAPGFDFGPRNTYFVDQGVTVVDDSGPTAVPEPMPPAIEAAIDQNMQRLGYTKTTQLTAANVGLKASILRGTGAVYYPGYWCDYWTYYGCYYSWYYAGSYRFGTFILEMADLVAAPPNPDVPPTGPIPILWTSAVYGIATSQQYDVQRVADGVNRAFAQSPYLDSN